MKWLSIFCLGGLVLSASAAELGALDQPLETVGQYELLEVGFTSPLTYDNPHDPDEVSLEATLYSPQGKHRTVNGYWDGYSWRLRFCEGIVGEWTYQVSFRDNDSMATAEGSFEVVASKRAGWVGISKEDPRYLVRDEGKSFYGVGVAVPWFLNPTRYGHYRPYGDILGQLEKNGCNLFYYMLPHWGNNIVSLESGYATYDLSHCNNIDTIVRNAEDKGISMVFTVWMHDVLRDAAHPWSADNVSGWSENPFSELTDCKGFFVDSKSWKHQQNLYRYIIARWGYSPAVAFWNTVAEIDGSGAIYSDGASGTGERSWFRKINNYFQQNDPFNHPTTASMSGDRWWPEANELSDATQIHTYDQMNHTEGIAERVGYWSRRMFANYNKPALIGEFGKPNYEEGVSEHFVHDGIWASFMNGGAITPLHWWGGFDNGTSQSDWDQFTPSMFEQLSNLHTFVKTIDLPAQHFRPSTSKDWNPPLAYQSAEQEVRNDAIVVSGMFGDLVSVFWLQGEGSHGTLALSDLAPGKYDARFYDTWTGEWISAASVESDSQGQLELPLPVFGKDLAVRLEQTSVASPSGGVAKLPEAHGTTWFKVLGAVGSSENKTIAVLDSWYSNDEQLKLSVVDEGGGQALDLNYGAGYLQSSLAIRLANCNQLRLRFLGCVENSPGQLFVRFVHDTPEGEKSLADFYHTTAPIKEERGVWEIPCAGIDFDKVQRINLGVFSGEGASGEVLIDQIEFVGDMASASLLWGHVYKMNLLTSGSASLRVISEDVKWPSKFKYLEFWIYVPEAPNGLCARAVALDSTEKKSVHGRSWPLLAGRVNRVRITKEDLAGMKPHWLGIEFGGLAVDFSGEVVLVGEGDSLLGL